MWVVKASGETEKFDSKKIKRTCLKAGATEELANKIAKEVESKAYNGISTKEILHITLSLLNKEKPEVASRYDLKGAIFRLGPAGFTFEHLVAEIFKEYGYDTKVHSIIRGACVSHEVDVIASKENDNYMIECKYHNVPGIYTGLREVLYTYARFLDLQDGFKKGFCKKFNQPWLVCNTKFSEDAIQYAACKDMKLIGWNYPENEGLEYLIEKKKLYPITMLRSLDADSQEKLALAGLVLIKDLVTIEIKELSELTKIKKNKLKIFSEEAKRLLLN
ncbi:MAG: ATP cone domain-containing protein [Candidatus Aenigmatarchaeota archaeon]